METAFTHPATVAFVLIALVVLVFRGPIYQALERRRVDEAAREKGEQHKESNRSIRDSRNQDTHANDSDFKGSALSKSDSSESLREERVGNLPDRRRILLDKPQSVEGAKRSLEQAGESLTKARQAAIWYQDPRLAALRVRQAEDDFESCRSEHNRVLIEARDRTTVSAGQVRSGRQFKIGAMPRSAM